MSVLTASNLDTHSIDEMTNNISSTVTEISVTARIDYILRFSKQLVTVINDNNVNSFANEYIETLSVDNTTQLQTNVAFLFSSAKLNSIQIRCQIIEQLFSGSLFDPEMPLSTTVIKLTKNSANIISIVIDQAQQLSTEILSELAQLSMTAKNMDLPIHVVLFGSTALTNTIVINKESFENKITVISAANGQIININKLGRSKAYSSVLSQGKTKMLLLVSIIVMLITGTWYGIEKYTNLTFLSESIEKNKLQIIENKTRTKLNVEQNDKVTQLEKANQGLNSNVANSAEIYNSIALVDHSVIDVSSSIALVLPTIANPTDISTVLEQSTPNERLSAVPKQSGIDSETKSYLPTNSTSPQAASIEPVAIIPASYYLEFNKGNAVQMISFNSQNKMIRFKREYADLELHFYKKRVKDKIVFVVTSKVFTGVSEAKSFIANLPENLKSIKPWLIPVNLIHQHIQTF